MPVKFQHNIKQYQTRNLGSKNKSEKIGFNFFSFDSSRMDINVISVDREKSGLLINILNVYVPVIVPERSPF